METAEALLLDIFGIDDPMKIIGRKFKIIERESGHISIAGTIEGFWSTKKGYREEGQGGDIIVIETSVGALMPYKIRINNRELEKNWSWTHITPLRNINRQDPPECDRYDMDGKILELVLI
ncbi:MAG: hypothetical protein PHU42_00970 [Patescibacteria group bacterium]|nr:hypothetical protein [Patescibacteria group bacterium]